MMDEEDDDFIELGVNESDEFLLEDGWSNEISPNDISSKEEIEENGAQVSTENSNKDNSSSDISPNDTSTQKHELANVSTKDTSTNDISSKDISTNENGSVNKADVQTDKSSKDISPKDTTSKETNLSKGPYGLPRAGPVQTIPTGVVIPTRCPPRVPFSGMTQGLMPGSVPSSAQQFSHLSASAAMYRFGLPPPRNASSGFHQMQFNRWPMYQPSLQQFGFCPPGAYGHPPGYPPYTGPAPMTNQMAQPWQGQMPPACAPVQNAPVIVRPVDRKEMSSLARSRAAELNKWIEERTRLKNQKATHQAALVNERIQLLQNSAPTGDSVSSMTGDGVEQKDNQPMNADRERSRSKSHKKSRSRSRSKSNRRSRSRSTSKSNRRSRSRSTSKSRRRSRSRSPKRDPQRKSQDQNPRQSSVADKTRIGDPTCVYCSRTDHSLAMCLLFESLQMEQRWRFINGFTKMSICTLCLASGHRAERCANARCCAVPNCGAQNHSLLHHCRVQNHPPLGAMTETSERYSNPAIQSKLFVGNTMDQQTNAQTISLMVNPFSMKPDSKPGIVTDKMDMPVNPFLFVSENNKPDRMQETSGNLSLADDWERKRLEELYGQTPNSHQQHHLGEDWEVTRLRELQSHKKNSFDPMTQFNPGQSINQTNLPSVVDDWEVERLRELQGQRKVVDPMNYNQSRSQPNSNLLSDDWEMKRLQELQGQKKTVDPMPFGMSMQQPNSNLLSDDWEVKRLQELQGQRKVVDPMPQYNPGMLKPQPNSYPLSEDWEVKRLQELQGHRK